MNVHMSFRHLQPTEAIKSYAQEKLERIRKYFPEPISVHMVFALENVHAQVADIQITLHHGTLIKALETTEDMYSSIDMAMAKIERQVRRYKEKLHNHRLTAGKERLASYEEVPEEPSSSHLSHVIKEESYISQPLSVEEAIMHLNLRHETILCFHNAATQQINVIYKKDTHSYGLIETIHSSVNSKS